MAGKKKQVELVGRIVLWIRQQVKAAGAKGIVLGLSGGIDSAVVAILSKKAMGKKVLGVIMPCESNPQDAKDAWQIARRYGIPATTIKLDIVFRQLKRLLPKANRTAAANLKPRLRMTTLYYLANRLNYLVAGTGNKSEIMVGYSTKYGDAGADLLPIGDLFKTEVRTLAKQLGIPHQLVQKPPSAGLWENQTDEGELGLSYEELDRCLMVLEGNQIKGIPVKQIRRVRQLVCKSEHKRQAVPICHASSRLHRLLR